MSKASKDAVIKFAKETGGDVDEALAAHDRGVAKYGKPNWGPSTLEIWMAEVEKIARQQYGHDGLTAAERVTLASMYDDDVPVDQAVNEMFGTPPREAGES